MFERLGQEKKYEIADELFDLIELYHDAVTISEKMKEETERLAILFAEENLKSSTKMVKKALDEAEFLNDSIIERISSDENGFVRAAFEMGQFVGTYKTINFSYKKSLDSRMNENTLLRLLNKRYVKEMLMCILEKPGIKYTELLSELDIEKNNRSYLSQLSGELEKNWIINRYRSGKNTFYEIPAQYRDIIKRTIEGLIEEWVDEFDEIGTVSYDRGNSKMHGLPGKTIECKAVLEWNDGVNYRYMRNKREKEYV